MQSIKQQIVSPYRGSEATYEALKEQLRAKYGDECADEFDPHTDAMPLLSWASYGFRVKKGEKAFKSFTILEVKNAKGEIVKKIRRAVNIFHRLQVHKV